MTNCVSVFFTHLQIIVWIVQSHVYCSSWSANNMPLNTCHITEEENFNEW